MNEQNKKYVFWGLLAILALFLFYLLSSGGLSGDGVRAYRIGEHLERAGEYQQNAIQRLERIENDADRIQRETGEAADQIGRVEKRIEANQERLAEGERLARRGQEIIQGIRERGKIRTEKTTPPKE